MAADSVDWISIGLGLAIIAAVLWVYRNGQRSGAVAGKPNRQIGKLFAEIASIKTSLEKTATSADLELMSAEMKRVEGGAASAGMVIALEGKINALRGELEGSVKTLAATVDGVKETGEHTREGVSRIEAILMKGALDR